jgi:hypothetical protein
MKAAAARTGNSRKPWALRGALSDSVFMGNLRKFVIFYNKRQRETRHSRDKAIKKRIYHERHELVI